MTDKAELHLQVITGDIKDAGTDTNKLFARVCNNLTDLKEYNFDSPSKHNCMTVNISESCGDFNRNEERIIRLGKCVLDSGTKCNYKDMNYYAILNKDLEGWFVQSVKFTLKEGDRDEVVYHNPCLLRWVMYNDNADKYFSRQDTVACAVLYTGDMDKAGTNDDVWFHFGIVPEKKFDIPSHDDLEKGKIDVNGWMWRGNTFNQEYKRKFYIKKDKDGKRGGWYLHRVRAYLFRPGKSFADDPSNPTSFYGADVVVDKWLSDETGLTYPKTDSVMSKKWIQLEEMKPPYGFDTIGRHCN